MLANRLLQWSLSLLGIERYFESGCLQQESGRSLCQREALEASGVPKDVAGCGSRYCRWCRLASPIPHSYYGVFNAISRAIQIDEFGKRRSLTCRQGTLIRVPRHRLWLQLLSLYLLRVVVLLLQRFCCHAWLGHEAWAAWAVIVGQQKRRWSFLQSCESRHDSRLQSRPHATKIVLVESLLLMTPHLIPVFAIVSHLISTL